MKRFLLASLAVLSLGTPALAKDDGIRFEPTVELKFGKDNHCSGFHVGRGVIVTAGHCAEKLDTVYNVISTTGAAIGVARVAIVSLHEDVAILVTNTKQLDVMPIDCGMVRIGQEIEVHGWPDDLGYVATWGKINNLPHAFEPDWSQAYIVSAMFDRGVSGGPVIDTATGKAVGIVVGFQQPNEGGPIFDLAVPTSIACRLLDRSS